MKWTQCPQQFLLIRSSSRPLISVAHAAETLLNSSKTEIPPTHFSACLFFSSEKEKQPLTSGCWPGTIS